MSIQAPPRRTIERVPPRRRKPKRSIWRRTVWPVTKYLALTALIVMAGWNVVGKVARPFKLLHTEYGETRQVRAELESLKKENETLERRIRFLQTSEGAVQAARRLGYVKPGEITLVLPTEPVRKADSTSR